MVPKITECIFKVSLKHKGKRRIWCQYIRDGRVVTMGYSETSIELAYRDFRKQWKAFV